MVTSGSRPRGVANIADAATCAPIAGFDHHATPSSAHAGGARSRRRDSVSHLLSTPHAGSKHATTADLATTSTMASPADELIAALAEHQNGDARSYLRPGSCCAC